MMPERAVHAAPTPAEVQAIAALPDAVLRNLRITACYARLSASLATLTGPGANWCTFGAWASRQAGATIRGEDLAGRLHSIARCGWFLREPLQSLWRALLRQGLFNPQTPLGSLVRSIHGPFDAFERASDALADGNRRIIEEIGFEFARYLQLCAANPSPDSPAFLTFRDSLKPGQPPDGQQLLRQAFTHYQHARCESNPTRRAQFMLLANFEIGLHEQTRVQPEIDRALDAGIDTAEDLERRLAAHLGLGWFRNLLRSLLIVPARAYQRFLRDLGRRIVSESLMVLSIPGHTLRLGVNLELATPEIFAKLESAEILEAIHPFEPDPCPGCAVKDWSILTERMHYIFHFFRACHADPALFHPPFTPAQLEQIEAGRIPSGDL